MADNSSNKEEYAILGSEYIEADKQIKQQHYAFKLWFVIAIVILVLVYIYMKHKASVIDITGVWYINGYPHMFDHDLFTGVVYGSEIKNETPGVPEKIGKLYSLENGYLYGSRVTNYNDYRIVTEGFVADRYKE